MCSSSSSTSTHTTYTILVLVLQLFLSYLDSAGRGPMQGSPLKHVNCPNFIFLNIVMSCFEESSSVFVLHLQELRFFINLYIFVSLFVVLRTYVSETYSSTRRNQRVVVVRDSSNLNRRDPVSEGSHLCISSSTIFSVVGL